MKRILFFLCAGILVIPVRAAGNSAGQQDAVPDSIPFYRMEELVVTAKKIETAIENIAFSVSLVGMQDIKTALVNSSTDLAGVLPGVFIQRTGDFGRSDVNIRGLGSRGRYSLVLIDGVPERMALFDCTVTHTFPLHDVKRIEVVRGASSTLYGSGAMGGVMNVIPRQVSNALEIDARTSGGSYNTLVATGRVGARKGLFFGSLSADYRESDGHVEHAAYDATDIVLRAGFELSSSMVVSAYGKYFDGFKEEPIRYTDDPSVVSNTWNDYERGSANVKLAGTWEKFGYHARYYRNFGEHRFSDGWHSKDATDGLLVHATSRPSDFLEISGGTDYRLQQGEFPDEPDAGWEKWEAGVYLNAELNTKEVLIASAGVRYDRDEVSGEAVSPSLGIVAKPTGNTSIRALASHGFRSPQINELYMFPPSNENLEAERAWNYEVGLRQGIPGNLTLDATAFWINGENIIETGPNPSPPPMYLLQNTGSFEFNGIELSLAGAWRNGIDARMSWSYLDPGKWTMGRPGQKYDLVLAYRTRRHTLKLTGQHVDDYYAGNDKSDKIDSSTVFDIYIESSVAGGIYAFGGVSNLFDEEYAIFVDLPGGEAGLYEMPGRNFTIGLKYAY